MKKSLLVIGAAALIPSGVMAGGSHSDGHHHETEPAHHQDMGHGDDHHASGGHASMVGSWPLRMPPAEPFMSICSTRCVLRSMRHWI